MEWTIASGGYQAVIDQRGGGLRAFVAEGVPVIDGYAAGDRPPGGAGQVLAPWPNRIRDGRYDYGGRSYELTLTEPANGNAIHGLVRNLPWDLVEHAKDAVIVECHITDEPGYPFDLVVSTRWSVSADGLLAEHRAENNGPGPAPFGLGVHPYLLLDRASVAETELQVPADHVLITDARGLPQDLLKVSDTDLDFRSPRRIGDAVLDHAFTGLVDSPTVRLSHGEDEIELWLGPEFPWVQVFTGDTLDEGRRRRSIAVEPMTCPADAFNSGTDLVGLDAGRFWTGHWGIRVRSASAM